MNLNFLNTHKMRNSIEKELQKYYHSLMKRVIVHSDINHCYAQIEEMLNPKLRNVPMAVGGSEEKRHGIILAKNDLAKTYNIKTGESLRDARKKCPELVILHPQYDKYMYYTEKIKDIYRQYTDCVESFGLDEAWIDLTASQRLFGDGIELAKRIQDEVFQKFGITVSMGVSWNKVFAKLASDLFKHKGFAVITEEEMEEKIWPLEVSDLLMVGRRTEAKLKQMNIFTIGQLARADVRVLHRRFGVMGELLWRYANGWDDSEVHEVGYERPVKSVGNSKTVVKDIETMEQLHEVFRVLSESVAIRLRDQNLKGSCISIWLRGTDLKGRGCQRKLSQPTNLARDILETVMSLVYSMGLEEISLRSVGVHVSHLCSAKCMDQLDLFHPQDDLKNQRAIEETLYQIRKRYGYSSCRLASSRLDAEITDFDPLDLLHQVHPVGVLEGPIAK